MPSTTLAPHRYAISASYVRTVASYAGQQTGSHTSCRFETWLSTLLGSPRFVYTATGQPKVLTKKLRPNARGAHAGTESPRMCSTSLMPSGGPAASVRMPPRARR